MLSGTQYMLQKNPCTRLPVACILCLASVRGNSRWNSGVPDPATETTAAWTACTPAAALGCGGAAVPGDVETELSGHFQGGA